MLVITLRNKDLDFLWFLPVGVVSDTVLVKNSEVLFDIGNRSFAVLRICGNSSYSYPKVVDLDVRF